jgi:DNA polymerase III subunit epsilon
LMASNESPDGADPLLVVPARALQAFADLVQSSPLLAFHSAFADPMLERHALQRRAGRIDNPWADLAHMCGVTHPAVRADFLDEWIAAYRGSSSRCAASNKGQASKAPTP